MNIERDLVPEMTLEAFAEKHDLTLVVTERGKSFIGTNQQFYARFRKADVREGTCMLCGKFGDGRTSEDAIADYAREISQELLIVDAFGDERREIQVPRLTYAKKEVTP